MRVLCCCWLGGSGVRFAERVSGFLLSLASRGAVWVAVGVLSVCGV